MVNVNNSTMESVKWLNFKSLLRIWIMWSTLRDKQKTSSARLQKIRVETTRSSRLLYCHLRKRTTAIRVCETQRYVLVEKLNNLSVKNILLHLVCIKIRTNKPYFASDSTDCVYTFLKYMLLLVKIIWINHILHQIQQTASILS